MNPGRAASFILAGVLACAATWPARAGAAAAPAASAASAAASSPHGGQVGGSGRGAAAGSPAGAPSPPAAPSPSAPGEIGVWLAAGAAPQSTQPIWKDRPLSAGEARQLQRLRQAARRWQAALTALAAAARSQGDAALQADLVRLDALLSSLAWARQLTMASYAAALRSSSDALALWQTDAAYVEPGEQQAWAEADAGAAELTTEAETGFVFGIDLGSGQTWSYAEGGAAGIAPGGPDLAPGDAAAAGDAGEMAAGAGSDRDATAAQVAGPEAGGDMPIDPGPNGKSAAEAPADELGDLQGDVPPAPELRTLPPDADADAEPTLDEAAPPLAWEEISRPWQPGASAAGYGRVRASASACLLSPLP